MLKRLNLFVFLCAATTLAAHAQLSKADSLSLRNLLQGKGEIKLNRNAVQQIDFGAFMGTPITPDDKPSLQYDTKLPDVARPVTPKVEHMPLYLYLTVKFNYDPLTKRTFKVGPNTWRADSLNYLKLSMKPYTNKAQTQFDGHERTSVADIEATDLRYNLFAERANGMAVGAWQPTPSQARAATFHGITTTASGSTIGGLDLMYIFTKEAWDVKGRKRRERTLELLKQYGDSTTVKVNHEIPEL